MSRIRSIHPDIATNERFVSLSMEARVFFMLLWTECDDKGCFEWKPLQLKMKLFPADNVDVQTLLNELVQMDSIRKFKFGAKEFGAVRNFRKHQRPKKPNDIYPITEKIKEYVGLKDASDETSSPNEDPEEGALGNQFGTGGEKSPQMEDGGWRMDNPPNPPREMFSEFWESWPHKVSKLPAEKAWKKLSAEDQHLAKVKADAWCRVWRKKHPDASHILPATYLNQRRWVDEGAPTQPQVDILSMHASNIAAGRHFGLTHVTAHQCREMLHRKLVDEVQLKAAGLSW